MNELHVFKEGLLLLTLILPRMMAVFAVLPFFSKQLLQGILRNSLLLSFALVVLPLVRPQVPADLNLLMIIAIVVKELAVGVLIGFLLSLMFWVVESVGFLIDNQRGTTMASLVDPLSGEQTSPLGSLLLQAVVVWFFTSGGFLALLGGLLQSYQTWPIFSFFPTFEQDMSAFFLSKVDLLMTLIAVYAAPIIIAIFITEFGLGLVNRFAPQLNVFFLAMPIKSAVAGLVLVLYFMSMISYFRDSLFAAEGFWPMAKELFHE